MNKESYSSDEIEQFLDDVKDQIQYKPIRKEVEAELKAHIEDRILEYIDMGLEKREASHKALEQMGDAPSIGIRMNEARHVRSCFPLLIMVLVSVLLGILRNFIDYSVSWEYAVDSIVFNIYYFLFGLIVLAVVYFKGYTIMVKHFIWFFISLFILILINSIIRNYLVGLTIHYNSHVLAYGMLLLFGPTLAASLYRWRRKGVMGLLFYFTALITVLLLQGKCYSSGNPAELAFITSCIITLLFLIGKGYLSGCKKRLLLLSAIGILLSVGFYIGMTYYAQKENLELFLHPDKQATNLAQDGYNGVLMKELLRRSEPFGPIKLSKKELYEYGTGAWYFDEEVIGNHIRYLNNYKMKLTLSDILPEHYHNNYRIAYWILNYGWTPGLLLISFVLSLYVLLFIVTFRIKNKLGSTLALSCSVCLSVQMLLYLLGNFGYQYGTFSTLPFISEGLCSITTNMILVGLVLSAYRYDHVIREDALIKRRISIKSV